MNRSFRVLERGVVYIKDGRISAVSAADSPRPAGFKDVEVFDTGGTIYPGLIELHNHLSYNILRLWDVPDVYGNRDRWAQGDTYRKLVTGPMKVLAHTSRYVWAVVRYVECKCLLGGTTTSQGIALSSYAGIMHFYRGIVRNVEQTDDPDLPEAGTRIADVEAVKRDRFLNRQRHFKCLVLHLSEGTDEAARKHFLALQAPSGEWAITDSLVGIHCVALTPSDFDVLASHGASMVWSPLSNLLLYGKTADVAAAKRGGLPIALGPDWSPSGSKNLLGELKIARLASATAGDVFTDRQLVFIATRGAAEILRWEQEIGSLQRGHYADLIVVRGRGGDPYDHLLRASEADLELVVINGTARYGLQATMRRLLGPAAEEGESLALGGKTRLLNLKQKTADPDVATLTLAAAGDLLRDGLNRLPELATELNKMPSLTLLDASSRGEAPVFLVLDHDDLGGVDLRPHLPDSDGQLTAEPLPLMLTARVTPLTELLVPLQLDPLTVVRDSDFVERLERERNLPAAIKDQLASAFG
jgi:5-methylthioadenosine/S-adenosylhomocysteine deaminase